MDLPLNRRGSPPLQWVQTRVPGARELVLKSHWDQETTRLAKELNNANIIASIPLLAEGSTCRGRAAD